MYLYNQGKPWYSFTEIERLENVLYEQEPPFSLPQRDIIWKHMWDFKDILRYSEIRRGI